MLLPSVTWAVWLFWRSRDHPAARTSASPWSIRVKPHSDETSLKSNYFGSSFEAGQQHGRSQAHGQGKEEPSREEDLDPAAQTGMRAEAAPGAKAALLRVVCSVRPSVCTNPHPVALSRACAAPLPARRCPRVCVPARLRSPAPSSTSLQPAPCTPHRSTATTSSSATA